MKGTILTALLFLSTTAMADSVIITETKTWKSVPITVDDQNHTYTYEGTLPESEYYYAYPGKQPHEVPRALETSEVPRIVDDYRQAAQRAKLAGFDGVELHSANGYLIDEFLQSKTNHRTDQYGGSVENRYRFLNEVVEAVTSVWPADRVGVRLAPNGMYNDMGSPDFREQFTFVAQQLDRFGLAYLHIVDGLAFGFHQLGEPMTLAEFRKVFHGPLMGNCGYTKETAEKAIAEGHADLISFGRPFISNPDLVERFRNGWPLAEPARLSDWSSPTGAKGYTDFPAYETLATSESGNVRANENTRCCVPISVTPRC